MTEVAPTPVQPMSLVSRFLGVITSPKATFENVVAAPRPFGILFVCALLIGVGSTIPQLTEAGRKATLDMQVQGMERMGMTVTPEMMQRMEAQSQNKLLKAAGVLGSLIVLPIMALIFTALYWAFFNAILGGTATFKQVLAVVSHSYVISALGILVAVPIQLMTNKISMGGPFNLGALAPMLEESSTLARFLGGISIFSLWGFVVTGIGLGVLYKRNSRTISIVLIALFLVFMYAVTAMFGSFFGRG